MKQKITFYFPFDGIISKGKPLTKDFLEKFIGMSVQDENGNLIGHVEGYDLEHRWFIGVGEAEILENLDKRTTSVTIKSNEKVGNENDLISW